MSILGELMFFNLLNKEILQKDLCQLKRLRLYE
jgi:hypothetical protein